MFEPPCKKICREVQPESDIYKNVGIDAFLYNEGEGFSGQIKERWEDFIVNEVDLSGNLVIFKSDDLPLEKEDMKIDNKHLSTEILDKLDQCVNSYEKEEVVFEASDSKDVRSEIHKFIKSNYKTLYGNTEIRDEKRMFVITNFSDERTKIANRIAKQSGKAEFCQFVLYKEGKDTISAVALIAKFLRMNPGLFTYGGTKDKRGITTQLVTVKGCAANRLKGLNKCLNGVSVGNFEYVSRPLQLGDLYGNRFKLVIRNVEGSDDEISIAVERFRKGFINYFGLQRFGSTETRSHDIGMLAIASKWEEMIKLILEPTPQDLPYMRDCKTKFKETEDCEEFLNNAPQSIERSIVLGISKHGYTLNALDGLPRNLRQLYVHSFQSLVWNMMASRRIRTFGSETVLPGDLIEEYVEGKLRVGDDVCVCSEANVTKHCLADVVLPLPGYDIKLPENEVCQWYHDLLTEHGLTMDKLRHRVREFSLPGAYRKLISVPKDVVYSIQYYDDATVPLIETDVQKVKGGFNVPMSQGDKKAVIIEFTLSKSSYATIAIRELLKSVKVFQ